MSANTMACPRCPLERIVSRTLARPARAGANLIRTDDVGYGTPPSFNIAALGVILILIVFYATWW